MEDTANSFSERFRPHPLPPQRDGWTVDRKLSAGAIVAIVAQFVAVVALVVQARADIATNKRDIERNLTTITKVVDETSRIVRIDERLAGVVKGLADLNDRLDRLLGDKRGRR